MSTGFTRLLGTAVNVYTLTAVVIIIITSIFNKNTSITQLIEAFRLPRTILLGYKKASIKVKLL